MRSKTNIGATKIGRFTTFGGVMRRVLTRAVAVLALVTGLGLAGTVPADASPATLKAQQVTAARDWWF